MCEKIKKDAVLERSELQGLLNTDPNLADKFVPVKVGEGGLVTVIDVFTKHGPAYDMLATNKAGGDKCEMFYRM